MSALKETTVKAIYNLPEDASLDDILEKIIYFAEIEEGIRDAEAGNLFPLEDVVIEFETKKWIFAVWCGIKKSLWKPGPLGVRLCESAEG